MNQYPTYAERLRRLAATTALDGIADEMRAMADEMEVATKAEPVAWSPPETVPHGTPILVTDGHIVVACKLSRWLDGQVSVYIAGVSGPEWDAAFEADEIKGWMPCPAAMKGD